MEQTTTQRHSSLLKLMPSLSFAPITASSMPLSLCHTTSVSGSKSVLSPKHVAYHDSILVALQDGVCVCRAFRLHEKFSFRLQPRPETRFGPLGYGFVEEGIRGEETDQATFDDGGEVLNSLTQLLNLYTGERK